MLQEPLKVKLFSAPFFESTLEKLESQVNEWLAKMNGEIEVVQTGFYHGSGHYNSGFSVAIWYRKK